jgi:hypothetical protein
VSRYPRNNPDALYTLRTKIADLHSEMDALVHADELYVKRRDYSPEAAAAYMARFQREKIVREEILRFNGLLEAPDKSTETPMKLSIGKKVLA